MTATLMKLENEVLSVLCAKCKCCLAMTSHCWNCHNEIPIEDLCGCGNCKAKAIDYAERIKSGFNYITNIVKMKGTVA